MYVEADLLYSYVKPRDWLKEYAEKILKKFALTTSIVTIIEMEFVAKRDFDDDFANSILEKLERVDNLTFVPLDVKFIRKAIVYRKKYGLNIFDALHAANAFLLKKDIISTDRVYDMIDEIKRVDPRDVKIE